MNERDCAARQQLEDIRRRRNCQKTHGFNCPHQNIGGVLVSTPAAPYQGFAAKDDDIDNRAQILQKSALSVPGSSLGTALTGAPEDSRPQILQKSSLAVPDSNLGPALAFAPVVELNDQAVGLSTTDTSAVKKFESSTVKGPSYSDSRAADGRDIAMSQTGTSRPEDVSHKLRFSQSGLLYTLHLIREPVVDYQETRGVPRNEEITFLTLVTSLCTQAYTAAITILVMLWNLMPLVDGLVYFVRFFLDKLIDLVQTDDNKDRAVKAVIFFGELTIITFIIFMIVGLIFMPVYVLMARLFGKIFSMIAW